MVAKYILSLIFWKLIRAINAEDSCHNSAGVIFLDAETAAVPPTYFLLYTRNNPHYPQNLTFTKCAANNNYNRNKNTVILLHGYQGSPNDESIAFLKLAYLHYGDCNVVIVDWSIASSSPYFPNAIRNTLIVGKYIAGQLEIWKENCNVNCDDFHLIGFSLGGQVVGFAGKYKKTGKFRRITGLDIAGAYFASFPPKYKLHHTDANFVDVITVSAHERAIMNRPTGHVHFKPDGGQIGRGCGDEIHNDIEWYSCSHKRAVYLFASSLYSQCVPVGYQCENYDTFSRGECSECGEDGKQCAAMGIHAEKYADKVTNGTVTMYLSTTFTDDYCLYEYHVEVLLGSGLNIVTEVGKIVLIINNRKAVVLNKIRNLQFTAAESFQPGERKRYLMITTHDINPITNLQLTWYTTSPRNDNKLHVECVRIVPMNNLEINRSSLATFGTPNGEPITPGRIILLNLQSRC